MKASVGIRSNCEKEFTLRSIKGGIRHDGRQLYDYRNINIRFGHSYGHCEVSVGNTRVLAQVSCEIVKPPANRASEGQIYLNVDLSPMASPQYEAGRMSSKGVEVNRFIERCLRESGPVDLESLCIITGEKVWSLRVDVTVLDDSGNILDCACIAAIAALAHFRYPDVTVVGEEVTIHTTDEKDPVSLNVYHYPICVSLGFIESGKTIIVDPTSLEEHILNGSMLLAMNANREICCAQMSGGVFLEPEQILMCSKIASVKVAKITKLIKKELERDRRKRLPAEVSKLSISAKTFEEKMIDATGLSPITQTVAEPTFIDITDTDRTAEEQTNGISPDLSQIKSVRRQGPGTAMIGSGGASSWIMISDDDDDSNDVIEVGDSDSDVQFEINRNNTVEVITLGSDADSEEEGTLTLTSIDDGGLQQRSVPEQTVVTQKLKTNHRESKRLNTKERVTSVLQQDTWNPCDVQNPEKIESTKKKQKTKRTKKT